MPCTGSHDRDAAMRPAELPDACTRFRPRVSSSRPRGRRPGASDTRDTILAAARERFAAHGYDRTRIRDVAADAGVDAALVHYFFKSKDGLFAAAMELPFSPPDLLK